MDNYTINGTNIMTTSSQINETTLTLPYNARQTIEVAAINCIGTSGMAMFTYFESEYNCLAPMKIIKFIFFVDIMILFQGQSLSTMYGGYCKI